MLKPDERGLCEDCAEAPEEAWQLCLEDIHCLECCPDSHWDEGAVG